MSSTNQEPVSVEEIADICEGVTPNEGESIVAQVGAEYNAADKAKNNQAGESQ
jgi:hypothetical protein